MVIKSSAGGSHSKINKLLSGFGPHLQKSAVARSNFRTIWTSGVCDADFGFVAFLISRLKCDVGGVIKNVNPQAELCCGQPTSAIWPSPLSVNTNVYCE